MRPTVATTRPAAEQIANRREGSDRVGAYAQQSPLRSPMETRMPQHRHPTLAGLIAGGAILIAGSAAAHAQLVKSDPAANATVAAPKTVSLTFNEKLTPAFSKFELSMPAMNGMKVKMKTTVSTDHLTIIGKPQGKLMPGAYTITWHAASSDDGHKMDGTVPFNVK